MESTNSYIQLADNFSHVLKTLYPDLTPSETDELRNNINKELDAEVKCDLPQQLAQKPTEGGGSVSSFKNLLLKLMFCKPKQANIIPLQYSIIEQELEHELEQELQHELQQEIPIIDHLSEEVYPLNYVPQRQSQSRAKSNTLSQVKKGRNALSYPFAKRNLDNTNVYLVLTLVLNAHAKQLIRMESSELIRNLRLVNKNARNAINTHPQTRAYIGQRIKFKDYGTVLQESEKIVKIASIIKNLINTERSKLKQKERLLQMQLYFRFGPDEKHTMRYKVIQIETNSDNTKLKIYPVVQDLSFYEALYDNKYRRAIHLQRPSVELAKIRYLKDTINTTKKVHYYNFVNTMVPALLSDNNVKEHINDSTINTESVYIEYTVQPDAATNSYIIHSLVKHCFTLFDLRNLKDGKFRFSRMQNALADFFHKPYIESSINIANSEYMPDKEFLKIKEEAYQHGPQTPQPQQPPQQPQTTFALLQPPSPQEILTQVHKKYNVSQFLLHREAITKLEQQLKGFSAAPAIRMHVLNELEKFQVSDPNEQMLYINFIINWTKGSFPQPLFTHLEDVIKLDNTELKSDTLFELSHFMKDRYIIKYSNETFPESEHVYNDISISYVKKGSVTTTNSTIVKAEHADYPIMFEQKDSSIHCFVASKLLSNDISQNLTRLIASVTNHLAYWYYGMWTIFQPANQSPYPSLKYATPRYLDKNLTKQAMLHLDKAYNWYLWKNLPLPTILKNDKEVLTNHTTMNNYFFIPGYMPKAIRLKAGIEQTGGRPTKRSANTYKKTTERFAYKGRKYIVYKGSRGGSYIKSKGEYCSIKKLKA